MIAHNAIRAASTKEMTTEEWQTFRRSGIGGSDIAAICGLNKWRSPIDVYLSKVEGDTVEENGRMYWGKQLEAIVAAEFDKRHAEYRVERCNAILRHPQYRFAIANVDRMIEHLDTSRGVLEIKTTSAFNAKAWDDTVPLEYQAQGQWYLAVTGLSHVWFAVLIGGQEYREYRVERDEGVIKSLLETAKHFWDTYVEPKQMPAPVIAGDLDAIRGRFEPTTTETVGISDELATVLAAFEEAKIAQKKIDDLVSVLQAKAIDQLAGAESASGNGWKVTFRANRDSEKFDPAALEKSEPELYANLKSKYTKITKGARVFRATKVEE